MNPNDPYPTGRPEESLGSRTYSMSSKIMLSAIVILFFVVILMVVLHLYARWYLLRARRRHLRRRSRNRRATMVFFTADPSTAATSVVSSRGLDSTVIKSLPVFTFSDETHKDPIECAVCLSEFEEGESGRVLPSCKHTFHVDCIDMWFHSHSTCPLCRSLVEPHPGIETPAEEQHVIAIHSDPVSAIEPGSSSGLSDESHGSGPSAIPKGRKPAAIEVVPRRNFSEFENESTRNSPASRSFRSPMSRMLSFTRMLSRERRSASSPITGTPLQSPSLSFRIPMTESDIERGGEEIEPCSSSGLSNESHGSGPSAIPMGRKPAAIEVTKRNFSEFGNESTRNSPASHSFRSPLSRMLSFTRMLSREQRSGSSPITGTPPQSPSLSCISMTESDMERGR